MVGDCGKVKEFTFLAKGAWFLTGSYHVASGLATCGLVLIASPTEPEAPGWRSAAAA